MLPKFAVQVRDTGEIVWAGNALNPLGACRAARDTASQDGLGPFRSISGVDASEFSLRHFVVDVYAIAEADVTVAMLNERPELLDEDRHSGTFAARYLE